MKGFKIFRKGLVWHFRHYEENTDYSSAESFVVKHEMHFCQNPLDTLKQCELIDENGNLPEFAEVEAPSDCVSKGRYPEEVSTTKLHIGSRIDLRTVIAEGIRLMSERRPIKLPLLRNKNKAITSSNSSTLSDNPQTMTTCSGNNCTIISTGEKSQLVNSGKNAHLISTSDYTQVLDDGENTRITCTGLNPQVVSLADAAQIVSAGDFSRFSGSGNDSRFLSSGSNSTCELNGENSIGVAIGKCSMAKGVLGSWIALAEYDKNNVCTCIKSGKIDGEILMPDIWYTLKDGEFVEAEANHKQPKW